MVKGLPSMAYGDGITKRKQVQFGGYNHTLYAGDGEIYDMENMTSDHYPVLATRKKREKYYGIEGQILNGICVHGGKIYGMGKTEFLKRGIGDDGWLTGTEGWSLENTEKQLAIIGTYLIILPDKKYYDIAKGTFGSLEAVFQDGFVSIHNGTYAGEKAEANTLYAEGVNWGDLFRVGDAVEITGFSEACADNNKTIIIREIEGDKLRFYENSFTMPEEGWEEGAITIKRAVPDMDFICENENRLWGCKGSTIYASKLGDPFNWNVFDGLATDSFTTDVNAAGSYFATGVGSAGDFTGCISYMGYPCFFKEDHIYKVYGDKPSNFQVMGSASLGVAAGSGKSLAVAGETLFYLSRIGIVAYSGGIPQSVAEAFGNVKYKNAVAGSDGVKYYVSMEDEAGGHHLFVYDTRKNLWHREDDTNVKAFAWNDGHLFWLSGDSTLWYYGDKIKVTGEPISWVSGDNFESSVEFGDFTDGDPNKKGTGKLQLRIELDEGASVTIKMQFDSDGVWHEVKTLTATEKRSFYLPIIPRRADHYRIRIEGEGEWRLYSMVRESYSGSEI